MAELINGKVLAESIKQNIKNTIVAQGSTPGLATVLVGNDPASLLYTKLKKKAAEFVGMEFHEYRLEDVCTEEEVLSCVSWLNRDPSVHGIIVQLPLPQHLNEDAIIAAIDPRKDADGFHPETINALLSDTSNFEPALVKTILSLLALPEEPLEGKNALIIANAEVFSKPLVFQLERQNVAAEYSTPRDKNLKKKLENADIVIVAVGKKNFIKDSDCKKGAIVIDIGINETNDGVVGDVDPSVYDTKGNIAWVTPVPGGVGPVTVAMLLTNVLERYFQQTT